MDYYAVLGVASDADDDAIRRAFRGLVRRYHPDAGEGSSTERFRAVVEAYETLSDPVRRRAYDRSVARSWREFPVEQIVQTEAPVYRVPFRRSRRAAYAEPLAGWDDLFDRLFEEVFPARLFRW